MDIIIDNIIEKNKLKKIKIILNIILNDIEEEINLIYTYKDIKEQDWRKKIKKIEGCNKKEYKKRRNEKIEIENKNKKLIYIGDKRLYERIIIKNKEYEKKIIIDKDDEEIKEMRIKRIEERIKEEIEIKIKGDEIIKYIEEENDEEIEKYEKICEYEEENERKIGRNMKKYIEKKKTEIKKKIYEEMIELNEEYKEILEGAEIEYKNEREEIRKIKKIFENIQEIEKIKEIYKEGEIEDDKEERQSLEELYASNILLTDWREEMRKRNCMGILIDINTTYMTRQGYEIEVGVRNITTEYYPCMEYLINKKRIEDNNALYPVYINKEHWGIVKKYIKMVLGKSISRHPLIYNKKYILTYYIILTEMTGILVNEKKARNDRYIKTYISFLRTTMQISYEEKYSYGIKKYIKKYIKKKKREDIRIIIGQCISTGYKIKKEEEEGIIRKEEEKEIIKIYKIIRRILEAIYKKEGGYNKYIKELDKNNGIIKREEIEYIKKEIKKISNI